MSLTETGLVTLVVESNEKALLQDRTVGDMPVQPQAKQQQRRRRTLSGKRPSRPSGKDLRSAAAVGVSKDKSYIASRENWDLPQLESLNSGCRLAGHKSTNWTDSFPSRPHVRPKTKTTTMPRRGGHRCGSGGGEVECCAHTKRTMLWAAATGESRLMAFLLAQQTGPESDVSFTNHYGQTALSLAAEHGHGEVMRLLLAHHAVIDVNAPDIDGQSPLAWAAFQGHRELVEMLVVRDCGDGDGLAATVRVAVNSKDCDGNTALSWAAANGHHGVAELLVSRVDVEKSPVNHRGETPRALAEANGHFALAALLRNVERPEANRQSDVRIR